MRQERSFPKVIVLVLVVAVGITLRLSWETLPKALAQGEIQRPGPMQQPGPIQQPGEIQRPGQQGP